MIFYHYVSKIFLLILVIYSVKL